MWLAGSIPIDASNLLFPASRLYKLAVEGASTDYLSSTDNEGQENASEDESVASSSSKRSVVARKVKPDKVSVTTKPKTASSPSVRSNSRGLLPPRSPTVQTSNKRKAEAKTTMAADEPSKSRLRLV